MEIKYSLHCHQKREQDTGHDIPEKDVEAVIQDPFKSHQQYNGRINLSGFGPTVDYPITVIVSAATSAGVSFGRVVTAYKNRRLKRS